MMGYKVEMESDMSDTWYGESWEEKEVRETEEKLSLALGPDVMLLLEEYISLRLKLHEDGYRAKENERNCY